MGVVLWNQIDFTQIGLKLSNDVLSGGVLADPVITVHYEFGQAGTVKISIKDLPVKVQDDIATGLNARPKDGLDVEVKLGYLDDRSSLARVFKGRIESSETAGFRLPTAILLTGTEEAAAKLQKQDDKSQRKVATLGIAGATADDLVNRVVSAAGVPLVGKVALVGPAKAEGAPAGKLAIDGANGLVLLKNLAEKFDAEVLVQDGKVLFGSNLKYPPEMYAPSGAVATVASPSALAALFTREDTLVVLKSDKGVLTAQLADFKPFKFGAAKKKGASRERLLPESVQGFDFTVAGNPWLRAGQMVVASVTGYQNPFQPFRILYLTHSYSSADDGGYTCTGRAVTLAPTGKSDRGQSELAGKASPLSVADKIAGKAKEAQTTTSPATDVGRVAAVKAAEHQVSVEYGQLPTTLTDTPSVDLDIHPDKDGPQLVDKPVASLFAWHQVGLSLPAYAGMRALLSQVRGSRNDTVVTGYLWSNEPKMDKPPAKDGDWWLCLPTELSGKPPQPSKDSTGDPLRPAKDSKCANDLTAGDGRRVVEAIGLKIAVGKGACTTLGTRPTEGDADALLITHSSGTTVQIDSSGNVTVDGKKKVVLKAGGVTLTVGDGKVAIG